MRKKLMATVAVALVAALALPSSAFAYNWTKSPVDPLIQGGVHSKAKFTKLLTSSKKVRSNLKAVIKADGYPSWVFDAAVQQAASGKVYSGVLGRGTAVGSMGFGLKKARIVNKTVWKGKGRLPYYYVNVSQTTTEGAFLTTTSFRVCLAKTCANPFVIGRRVTRRAIQQSPQVYNLYVEKRNGSLQGPLMSEWEVTGTVTWDASPQPVDVWTSSEGPTLVGQFPAGATYDLHEVLVGNWQPVSPGGDHQTGTMPAQDLTLVFVNEEVVD
jgi:hypothetical protein